MNSHRLRQVLRQKVKPSGDEAQLVLFAGKDARPLSRDIQGGGISTALYKGTGRWKCVVFNQYLGGNLSDLHYQINKIRSALSADGQAIATMRPDATMPADQVKAGLRKLFRQVEDIEIATEKAWLVSVNRRSAFNTRRLAHHGRRWTP